MKNFDQDKNDDNWQKEQEKLFKQLESPFNQDKGEVWAMLSDKIDASTVPSKPKVMALVWPKIAVAAVLLIVSTITFCSLHTTTINCQRGMHLAHQLPDGSTVELNAATSISYAPYWWYFSRSLQLEGEAFFEVKKGSKFSVHSAMGKTEVLGTSFNIFARDAVYKVLCTTGKVKVSAKKTGTATILAPNEMLLLEQNKTAEVSKNINSAQITSWKNNLFHFQAVPLKFVFEEIERQYNVNINHKNVPLEQYRGSFEKTNDIESTLNLICLPFNLKFVTSEEKNYTIISQ